MARSVRELMQAVLDEAALSVDDTAVLLSLSRHGAYEGVKAGQIPSMELGAASGCPAPAFAQCSEFSAECPPKRAVITKPKMRCGKTSGPKLRP